MAGPTPKQPPIGTPPILRTTHAGGIINTRAAWALPEHAPTSSTRPTMEPPPPNQYTCMTWAPQTAVPSEGRADPKKHQYIGTAVEWLLQTLMHWGMQHIAPGGTMHTQLYVGRAACACLPASQPRQRANQKKMIAHLGRGTCSGCTALASRAKLAATSTAQAACRRAPAAAAACVSCTSAHKPQASAAGMQLLVASGWTAQHAPNQQHYKSACAYPTDTAAPCEHMHAHAHACAHACARRLDAREAVTHAARVQGA